MPQSLAQHYVPAERPQVNGLPDARVTRKDIYFPLLAVSQAFLDRGCRICSRVQVQDLTHEHD